MKQNDIIRMALRAGICVWADPPKKQIACFEHFAALIIIAEREECAKLIESPGPTLANGAMFAEAIRAKENEIYENWKAFKKERKEQLGLPCPDCSIRLPEDRVKILMPNQKCRCGYVDKRARGQS